MTDHDWRYIGNVTLRNCHGCYLSWAPGGDCRANERNVGNEEIWMLYAKIQNGKLTFKFAKPIPGGLTSYMSCAGDKRVNCNASFVVASEWEPIYDGSKNKWAFKCVGGDFLCNEPPSHSRSRQVLADRKAINAWETFTMDDAGGFKESFFSSISRYSTAVFPI